MAAIAQTAVPDEVRSEEATAIPHHHPKRGFARRAGRLLAKATRYCDALGPVTGMRWYVAKIMARLPVMRVSHVRVTPPGILHPVGVRMFPSSDDFVFDQIFVEHEYEELCKHIEPPAFILDLGANVGYASALFASRFPEARILAVEPHPGNYEACRENLEPYGARIKTLQGAVWSRRSHLAIALTGHCDNREWSARVIEPASNQTAEVEAWDMSTLLDMAGESVVDLAKIDIEGSEAEVFASRAQRWLPRVKNICIELHGDNCRTAFFEALKGYQYDVIECREYTLCLNLRPAAVAA